MFLKRFFSVIPFSKKIVKTNEGSRFKKQSYKKVFKFQAYKKSSSDLWGILYNSSKRCRVVKKLYYLFSAFPCRFLSQNNINIPSVRVFHYKNRNNFTSVSRNVQKIDYFKLLCTLKFKSFGGLQKPGQGSRLRRRRFNIKRLRIFYGNYSWYFWFKFIKKRTRGGGDSRHEYSLFDFFESRLAIIIYRSTLLLSLYDSFVMVRLGKVMINNVIQSCPNVIVQNYDFISFIPSIQSRIRRLVFFRLKFFRFLFGAPLYLEVDYNLCNIVYIRFFFNSKNINTTFNVKTSILEGSINNFK